MNLMEIPMTNLRAAPWNPNQIDPNMASRLRESLNRFGLVEYPVVRQLTNGHYEVLSGNQRLRLLEEMGRISVPCLVVDLDDTRAKLLAQVLNHVHGEDDLGLKAALFQDLLNDLPQEELLSLLPETAHSLTGLSSLGQNDMAEYLKAWQGAEAARLKHLTVQLTQGQQEVVEKALSDFLAKAKANSDDNPNVKEKALYLLCLDHLVLQRRITKYFVFPFVFGCQRAIAVGSSHHVIRFKSFSKIALPEEPSL